MEVVRKPRKADEELVAITKAYDLVREMTRRVGRFPRDSRFSPVPRRRRE